MAHAEGLARAGIVRILHGDEEMSVVAEAASGSQAVHLSKRLQPDIAIIDGGRQGLGSPEVIKDIAELGSTDVLMLTPHQVEDALLQALSAGAVGFLPMDTDAQQLLHVIRLIAGGLGFMDPTVIRSLVNAAANLGPEELVTLDDRFARVLTPREQQVLAYVSQGFSNLEIADLLTVSENTVKTHVSRVLGKLGLRSRVEAALSVRNSWVRQRAG
ncbi:MULTISPECIES: response regulator transcription factor [Streptomyces]|uniref:LuxR C-terminal-related transcriptional regulator n=1 Tax=Streptomyces TaxID=1883 RepID=UPI0014898B88|nr:response regulator transcription factor [Streptomyces sp. Z423-1]